MYIFYLPYMGERLINKSIIFRHIEENVYKEHVELRKLPLSAFNVMFSPFFAKEKLPSNLK